MEQAGNAGFITQDLVSLRRDFHRFPEPGFGEFRTAGIVSDFLRRRGFRVKIADEAMNMAAIHYRDESKVAESAERAMAGGMDKGLVELMLSGGLLLSPTSAPFGTRCRVPIRHGRPPDPGVERSVSPAGCPRLCLREQGADACLRARRSFGHRSRSGSEFLRVLETL